MPDHRPLLIYDGDCEFCRLWAERWRRATGERVGFAPYQEIAGRFPQIPIDRFRRAVQLITADGRAYEGADAVFRALAESPRYGWVLRAYRNVPGFRAVCDFAYRGIARHRGLFLKLTRLLWRDPAPDPRGRP